MSNEILLDGKLYTVEFWIERIPVKMDDLVLITPEHGDDSE